MAIGSPSGSELDDMVTTDSPAFTAEPDAIELLENDTIPVAVADTVASSPRPDKT